MIIVADSKPLLVQYKVEGKLYGAATDGGTSAPFEEVRLAKGAQLTLGDLDDVVRLKVLGEEDAVEKTDNEG